VRWEDDLAAGVAACHHLAALWPQRYDPRIRRWIRGYMLQVRLLQDQCEALAATMRRERQEYQAMKDEETQVLAAL
jgi:hypothetical protein